MSFPVLSLEDFPDFFRAVHGCDPFPWQKRLLREVLEKGTWPEVLDLPTGSGKTAALDVAIFHLALQAREGEKRVAAMRIAFVVDRRLIVDDAHQRAKKVERALWSAIFDERSIAYAKVKETLHKSMLPTVEIERAVDVLIKVSTLLQSLAGEDQVPLIVHRLRGGVPREDDWARTPVQPTVLCSTVDQVGSRLLFRGYGVSQRMMPVHAGLLGADCLILLDEAHLSEPFRQTLKAIVDFRQRGKDREHQVKTPFAAALLTATPGSSHESMFRLEAEDYGDAVLRRRLNASKPAELVDIAGRQGVADEDRRVQEIASYVKQAVDVLHERGIKVPAVAAVVNRVARARKVFKALRGELGSLADVQLIIGPCRSIDREQLRVESLRSIRTGAERNLMKPLILVATQTIEVGVDIDLDGLVTEVASFDALRQRFGRLNRDARDMQPFSIILASKEDVGAKDDPIYGRSIANTWNFLKKYMIDDQGMVDFGIERMRERIKQTGIDIAECAAPRRDAPVMMPAYVDLLAQTWPIPNADPSISLFLHGPKASPSGVQILWRSDIQREDGSLDENAAEIILDIFPPKSSELIEIPVWAVRAWLRGDSEKTPDFSDGLDHVEEDEGITHRSKHKVFRINARSNQDGIIKMIDARKIRPGDIIAVPVAYGGCDTWGWDPSSRAWVADMAEEAAWPYHARRFAVRLTPQILRRYILCDMQEKGLLDKQHDIGMLESILDTMLSGKTSIEIKEEQNTFKTAMDAAVDRIRQVERSFCSAFSEDLSPRRLLDRVIDILERNNLSRVVIRLKKLENSKKNKIEIEYLGEEGNLYGVVFFAPFGIMVEKNLLTEEEATAADSVTNDDRLSSTPGYAQSLDEHASEVECWAGGFVKRSGLNLSIAADVALAAYLHDAGKADERFQAYLAGGDPLWFWGQDTPVLAKSGYRRLPAGTWKRVGLPDNWRHEALSVRRAEQHERFKDAHDPVLVLWLIGVHHGYGRPLYPHAPDEKDVEARSLPKVLGPEYLAGGKGPQCLDFEYKGMSWARLFEMLRDRYGAWNLAYLEACVRLADHRASEAAQKRYGESISNSLKEAAV